MTMVPVQNVSIQDHANVHLGDIYHVYHNQEPRGRRAFGLCLGSAPLINVDDFIGRAEELAKMAQILQPGKAMIEQRRLILGGMGGIGKTQLAISYARRHQDSYTSVFWFNATTELTLKASFRSIAQNIVKANDLENFTDEQVVTRVQQWLCDTGNPKWLLLYDNHDDPDQFEIDKYCANVGHGSTIITSRLPERVKGEQVRLLPLQNISECLDILRTRSQRQIGSEDIAARNLVDRLGGLPLALATAGAYLLRGSVTIAQYLHAYEQRWKVDPRRPPRLRDYENRTLYTTWDLTYWQIKIDDPDAAQLLRLMAYFNNQEISYELLRAGITDDAPEWLQQLLVDVFSFESVMSTLMEYCLVEKKGGYDSYSIHNCIHDWTFAELNKTLDPQLYWFAFQCVVSSIDMQDWDTLGQPRYDWTALHARRLTHERFRQHELFVSLDSGRLGQAEWLAQLLAKQTQLESATWLYEQILTHRERDLGPDHALTLHVRRELGFLYHLQDRFTDAESQYTRAMFGYKSLLGPDHALTLASIDNLGCLYSDRGLLRKAEVLLEMALTSYENVLGVDHASTLRSTNNMGALYLKQGKLHDAEHMLKRSLKSQELYMGDSDTIVFSTLHRLGNVYSRQGKTVEAEECYTKALRGYESLTGLNSHLTLDVVHNFGNLYSDLGRYEEAERMFLRALVGLENTVGPHSISTLSTVCSLARLYSKQHRLDNAEQMYLRGLAGREKALGIRHPSTLDTVHDLGILYVAQDKPKEAEKMYIRVIGEMEGILGSSHALVYRIVSALGHLYCCTDLAELENKYNSSISGERVNESLRSSLVIGLAGSLARGAMLAVNERDTMSMLSRLIKLVDRWKAREDLEILWHLVRPLLRIKDDVNAGIVLIRNVRQRNRKLSILCDGCDCRVELDTSRHICRRCVDIDVCNEYMVAYGERTITIPDCDGHDFFDAGSAVSKLLELPDIEEILNMETWMDKLKSQYPVDEVEDDGLVQPSASEGCTGQISGALRQTNDQLPPAEGPRFQCVSNED